MSAPHLAFNTEKMRPLGWFQGQMNQQGAFGKPALCSQGVREHFLALEAGQTKLLATNLAQTPIGAEGMFQQQSKGCHETGKSSAVRCWASSNPKQHLSREEAAITGVCRGGAPEEDQTSGEGRSATRLPVRASAPPSAPTCLPTVQMFASPSCFSTAPVWVQVCWCRQNTP